MLHSQRSKLLRFRDGEWDVRGQEEVQLLLHRDTGKVWCELCDGKTMHIVGNF